MQRRMPQKTVPKNTRRRARPKLPLRRLQTLLQPHRPLHALHGKRTQTKTPPSPRHAIRTHPRHPRHRKNRTRPQRPLHLRQRPKIQKMLWQRQSTCLTSAPCLRVKILPHRPSRASASKSFPHRHSRASASKSFPHRPSRASASKSFPHRHSRAGACRFNLRMRRIEKTDLVESPWFNDLSVYRG